MRELGQQQENYARHKEWQLQQPEGIFDVFMEKQGSQCG